MIEIIREEDISTRSQRQELPKDIKQIGKPDIGDRIYVENRVYQFLHPYNSLIEKRAYVLLGRFENFAGKQCVFVEEAIALREVEFDGELPRWNDHTWAYIYKELRHEYDSLVIVGWAMDIKGQLPNMTARLESLHQSNFGGAHQVLFLMDSLEREETFYGNRNGHLYRREGFYIYYEKERSAQGKTERSVWDIPLAEEPEPKAQQPEPELVSETESEVWKEAAVQEPEPQAEPEPDIWKEMEEAEQEPAREEGFLQQAMQRGSYRKQLTGQEGHRLVPSYASTLLLAVVVCTLGVTAYLNHEKMAAMEETIVQMRQTQTVATGQNTESSEGTEIPEVKVETVAGNVQPQNDAPAQDAVTAPESGGAAGAEPPVTADAAGADASTVSAAGEDPTVAETDTDTNAGAGQAAAGDNIGGDAAAGAAGAAAAGDRTGGSTAVGAEGQSPDTSAAVTEAQAYLNQGYYVVQKGDSLVGICRKIYQTTAMMDKLCEINGIENQDAIYAGQYLTLPN